MFRGHTLVAHRKRALIAFLSFFILLLLVVAMRGGTASASAATNIAHEDHPEAHGIVSLAGYRVSLFASSTSSFQKPDSLVVEDDHVFIDYQNVTAKDCTDTNHSTIVEYTMSGKVVKTFNIPGHSDGMRFDPSTHLLWTTSCEDGNPKFATIDPQNGKVTSYTFPTPPHGGGYDDLYFLNGKAFLAASNPTLDSNGVNSHPAVDEITLSNGHVILKPILFGNAPATDHTTTPPSQVTLNLTDPDSLSTDGKGNLVLVSQADSELIVISHPGTAQQSVSRLPVGTQLDDTVWATAKEGRLLVSDSAGNTYWVSSSHFVPGTIYTELPSDSGVAGALGVVNSSTGIITPIAIGFTSPTGMLFVPDSDR